MTVNLHVNDLSYIFVSMERNLKKYTVYLTDDQKELADKGAKLLGINFAAYVRLLILKSKKS